MDRRVGKIACTMGAASTQSMSDFACQKWWATRCVALVASLARVVRAVAHAITMVMLLAVPAAQAQPAKQFYRGKTVTMIVPADPGGSYDLHTRLIARHIGKWIP